MNLVEPADSMARFFELLAEKETVVFKSATISNDYFSESLFSSAKQKFSRDGYLYTITNMMKYYSALDALRVKNKNLYHVLVNQAIAGEEPSRLLENRLISSCSSAIVAYEKYTKSEFGEAAKLLEKSFKIDTELETDGFEILHFHKIQLMHNYARIYLKTDRKMAVNLLLDLAALTGKNIDFKYSIFFINHNNNYLLPSLNGLMFLQICNELLINYLTLLADGGIDLLTQSSFSFLNILHDLQFDNKHLALFTYLFENLLKVQCSDIFIKLANQITDFILLEDGSLLYYKVFLLTLYYKVSLKLNYSNSCQFNITLQTLFNKYINTNKFLFNLSLRNIYIPRGMSQVCT